MCLGLTYMLAKTLANRIVHWYSSLFSFYLLVKFDSEKVIDLNPFMKIFFFWINTARNSSALNFV